jgi:organic hydroperoxide reductase OsmC/OhrA
MTTQHNYRLNLRWTGNLGSGTSDYRAYSRNHVVEANGKSDVVLSSDPTFRGDRSKHNPEELLLASLSSCHMLWFLHLCADAGIVVLAYEDQPHGVMDMNPDGSGQFREVTLHPSVTISDDSRVAELEALHNRAHDMCFIARSVNFSVKCKSTETARPEIG